MGARLSATPVKTPSAYAEHPPAWEIVDRAVARAEAQYQARIDAMFEAQVLSSVRSLDGDSQVTEMEITKYLQYPLHGALYDELIEMDGRALSEKEVREEAKKRQEFIRGVRERIERGEHPQPESGPGVRFNQEFVGRYEVKVVGSEAVRGHRCWMIDFEPRKGKLPVRDRMDRALNRSTGRFWISREDYGLVRLEFALREPFKYWGGLVAVIRNTEGVLDFSRVEPDVWLPANFDLKLDLKIMLVKNIRRHISKKWTDYRRAAGTAEDGPQP